MSKRYYGGFISATQSINGNGMQSIASNQLPLTPVVPPFIVATGGTTITTSGNYKIHTFTSSGTFTVTTGKSHVIEYLVIGGGGAGGSCGGTSSGGGGGGAGGFLESYSGQTLGSDFSGARIYVTTGDVFTVTVGAGGTPLATPTAASDGVSSSIIGAGYSVTALGGGAGGKYTGNQSGAKGRDGGSGGGNGGNSVGNEPGQCVLSPRQGYRPLSSSAGVTGGGAGAANGTGRASSISGSTVTYSAGGVVTDTPAAGAANTGNGGTAYNNTSGLGLAGGSGIVIIRYLYQ